MLCPRCGAYSPYNTAVCNRCGTNLLGKKAGKSPRRSRSERYYRRVRKSEWERSRDQMLARANDTLDDIMADKTRRTRFFIIAAAAALAVLLCVAGGISCACGGCSGCSERPVVSDTEVTPVQTSQSDTDESDVPDEEGNASSDTDESDVPDEEENTPSDTDIPKEDTSPSDTGGHFGMDALFG